MVVDLPKAAHTAAITEIAAVLAEFTGTRQLESGELASYHGWFQHGWALTGLCVDPALELRVLLPSTVPFFPPRIAVAPPPPALTWPHLEDHGLLCLLPEVANVSIVRTAQVVTTMLEDARKLVNASLSGSNLQDFEDEFTSYWERWERSKSTVRCFCEPAKSSRNLIGWASTDGWYVAEDENFLRSWIANRFGKGSPKKITCWPVPLLWLPRPLRPAEYPTTVAALRAIFQENPQPRGILDTTLLGEKPDEKLILLGATSRNGLAFAGVLIHKLAGLKNGFRTQPPQEVALARYGAATTTGACIVRFDPEWVHGRDQNPETRVLRGKQIVIVGVGSVGSIVADLLVKAGVGKLTLVDPQELDSANSSRHLLGAPSVAVNKAEAVAHNLTERFPHLSATAVAKSITDLLQPVAASLRSSDLTICLTGNWPTESLLNAVWQEAELPPVLYGWAEPHAAAGHALMLMPRGGCLRCVVDEMGRNRVPVTTWPRDTMLHIPACGGVFQPYGAAELAHIGALVAELALDLLLQRVLQSTYRVWIGSHRMVQRAGGAWNPAWIAVRGNPAAGGQIVDVPFTPSCTDCGVTL